MAISKHAGDPAKRCEEAAWKVDAARQKRASGSATREWLGALTDLVFALSEVEKTDNQLVQEKLDLLARFVGIDRFVGAQAGRKRSARAHMRRPRAAMTH